MVKSQSSSRSINAPLNLESNDPQERNVVPLSVSLNPRIIGVHRFKIVFNCFRTALISASVFISFGKRLVSVKIASVVYRAR